jgi:hypothetical protein
MKLTKTICICSAVAIGASALASGNTTPNPSDWRDLSVTYVPATATAPVLDGKELAVTYVQPQAAAAAAVVGLFVKPKVGIRVGIGQYDQFVLNGGIDVTFNVPFIPLPAIRVDGEVWSGTSNSNHHGDALSLLGVQTFALGGYAGLGPTYYFADDKGNHHSGFGAKALVGMGVPGGFYVEGGLIVGPSPIPLFITIGMRF